MTNKVTKNATSYPKTPKKAEDGKDWQVEGSAVILCFLPRIAGGMACIYKRSVAHRI
jgi:hypothetical protein